MKIIFIILCLTLIPVGLSSCNTKEEKDVELANVLGISQEEVHKILGKPSGVLSGVRGDVYLIENKTKITVYYDDDIVVEQLLIADKAETKTFGLSADITKAETSAEQDLTSMKEMSQEEVHKILGKPSGALFGARGDVYLIENGTKATIYYDNDGMIKQLLITDKDEKETFTTEL